MAKPTDARLKYATAVAAQTESSLAFPSSRIENANENFPFLFLIYGLADLICPNVY